MQSNMQTSYYAIICPVFGKFTLAIALASKKALPASIVATGWHIATVAANGRRPQTPGGAASLQLKVLLLGLTGFVNPAAGGIAVTVGANPGGYYNFAFTKGKGCHLVAGYTTVAAPAGKKCKYTGTMPKQSPCQMAVFTGKHKVKASKTTAPAAS